MDEKPEEKPPVIDNVKHFGIICEPTLYGLVTPPEGEPPNGSVQQAQ